MPPSRRIEPGYTEYGTRTGDRIDAGCHFSRPDQKQTQRAGTEGVGKGSEDRIQHDQTADADLQFDAVHQDGVEGSGNGDGCGFCAGGLDRAGFFRKKRF